MGRREQNKAEKRSRIEETALPLFLDHGFERASIEQVIAGADIARGTFYLYYADKLTLFQALQRRWLTPTNTLMSSVYSELLDATSPQHCVQIYQKMGQEMTAITVGHAPEILLALRELKSRHDGGRWLRTCELELQEQTTTLTQLAADRGLITADNPQLASLIIFGGVERLVYEVLSGRELGNPVIVATHATALLSRILGLK
jgi:AcrR family transcriptional regulator